ncbi:MAG: type II secretion system F family protein [Candidatus Omnitrophota bacterium]
MPRFKYVAKDAKGKTVSGQRNVSSREELITELDRKGLYIVSIVTIEEAGEDKEKKSSFAVYADSVLGAKVKTFDLIILCRLLGTMLQGGVPILRAISSIADETKNRTLVNVLKNVLNDLRDGRPLSESFEKHPKVFSVLFNAIVSAGEKVGALDKMLFRLSVYLEAKERLAKKVTTAMTYPLFILGFFFFSIGILTLYVVPRFENIYGGFGSELPALTLFVFGISNFILRNIVLFLLTGTISVFTLFIYVKNTRRGRTILDTFILRIPVFGEAIKKAALSKFCRTLATLLDQGVSIGDALTLVGKTAGNILIEDASDESRKLILGGESIPEALQKMRIFPPLMLQMAWVGVESGSLPELMDKTAGFYEEQVENFVNSMTTMIEPILVVSLGTVIGFVVLALYLPIFNLSSVMSGSGNF